GALFGVPGPVTLSRQDSPVPGWRVQAGGESLGLIGSTWEIAGSTGYSGQPLDVLVAVTPDAKIAGARLVRHAEPVLTLGISDADIARYVNGFAGVDLNQRHGASLGHDPSLPDVISRATVSTGVIRDGILRSARALAFSGAQAGIDRVGYRPADWPVLAGMGALARTRATMTEAARAFEGAKTPVTPGDGTFIELYAGLIDPPTVGRNLLGQKEFTRAAGDLAPGEVLLAVLSSGLYSHRGADWRQQGQFPRLRLTQGGSDLPLAAENARVIEKLAIANAPDFKEVTLIRVAGLDPLRPFRLTLTATRDGAAAWEIPLDITLPEAFRISAPDAPLWLEFWQDKRPALAVVAAMLAGLALILFAQEAFVRRPKLWRRVRTGYLAVTLVVLGWGLGGQLSVVQVMAFLHALLAGFRWETFLVAPVIFVLWSAVALGMLFWGRGVYCGWLCPFGALQELTNQIGQRLGVKQIPVPQALHERLWVIKYTAFVGLVALSFYSMEKALVAAEWEPFKTAISMRMMRAWPFVLFVLAILGAGLFIERFYCRYMCPLGAGLAIPAKLKIFDWLRRRPQCGRECRLCEQKCTVGAIDPLGRINPNECVLCLRCQVVMNDAATCPVLKRRARSASTPEATP
ncbi:MAG: 4Fe-4S binding protein, partial [Tepidimonas taiwanensis]|nr:4Fe-4S binding protein [Tepidimonas taiwanensis]